MRARLRRGVASDFARDAVDLGFPPLGRSRGRRTSKIHCLADDRGRPVAFALTPGNVADLNLHVTNHAVSGALFFEMAAVVAATIVATQTLSSRIAMLVGLGLMIPSVALVTLSQAYGSLWTLIGATGCCGVAAGLGYRGSLQVVNQIAPSEKRAAVVSSYFICGFSGSALPVIGIGVISTLAGSAIADTIFAGLIIAFALAALGFDLFYAK